MQKSQIVQQTIEYRSSVDACHSLVADIAHLPHAQKQPLVLVMHGYACSRKDCAADINELAAQGVVAVAPDMRGQGDSGGTFDSGGLDVHDIVDAAHVVMQRWPDLVDPRNINIVGYSGGGGNAISAGCRFPDLFNTVVSFFGIPDYGGWFRDNTRPDCMEIMQNALGRPVDCPATYEARNMVAAAGNSLASWRFFWDVEETMCPGHFVDAWIAAYKQAGGTRVTRNVSGPGDERRWLHGYRSCVPDLRSADPLFVPEMKAGPRSEGLQLPPTGELVVPGYLVTKHFSVMVGDGQAGSVRIRYELSDGRPHVEVIHNPRNLPVSVKVGSSACGQSDAAVCLAGGNTNEKGKT